MCETMKKDEMTVLEVRRKEKKLGERVRDVEYPQQKKHAHGIWGPSAA